ERIPGLRRVDGSVGTIRIRSARRKSQRTIHADIAQLAGVCGPIGIVCRPHWIARQVNDRTYRSSGTDEVRPYSPAVPIIEISKNSIARAWSQHRRIRVGALPVQVSIEQGIKERFVFDDRTADATGQLVVVEIIDWKSRTVVRPGIGIRRAVLNAPNTRTV